MSLMGLRVQNGSQGSGTVVRVFDAHDGHRCQPAPRADPWEDAGLLDLKISDLLDAIEGSRVVSSTLQARRTVTALTWSSTTVAPGGAFLAFPGARVDGNDFTRSAMRRGATCVLMTREPTDAERAVADELACTLILVPDGLVAITAIAEAWRARITARTIAVTGSTGKTTTKDLLACVLSPLGNLVATAANQNNELGVPATVLSADPSTDVLVVEVGMQSLHEIEEHCARLIHPSIGVVTNVGLAHLELLGSQDDIARAKAEVLESLPDDGLAVVPGDDAYRDFLIGCAQRRVDSDGPRTHDVDVLTFGLSEGCDVRAIDVAVDAGGRPSFTLVLPDGSHARVDLPLVGAHNVLDALAAAAVAYHLGLGVVPMASSLSDAKVTGMRMEVISGRAGVTVVNDAYNANPDSMRAALDALLAMEVSGRRIAVLGDMGELGPDSTSLHCGVGDYVAHLGIDGLVCVGPYAHSIGQAAVTGGMPRERVVSCDTLDEAQSALSELLHPGDCVLLKASRSMGFEQLAKGLVD